MWDIDHTFTIKELFVCNSNCWGPEAIYDLIVIFKHLKWQIVTENFKLISCCFKINLI